MKLFVLVLSEVFNQGKIESRRRRERQRVRQLDDITYTIDMSLSKLGEFVWEAWRAAVHGAAKSQTLLTD